MPTTSMSMQARTRGDALLCACLDTLAASLMHSADQNCPYLTERQSTQARSVEHLAAMHASEDAKARPAVPCAGHMCSFLGQL